MKVYKEQGIENFQAWEGAINTQERIVKLGLADQFDFLIEDLYPDGLSSTELNDLLWFEPEWIFECLGVTEDEEDEEE